MNTSAETKMKIVIAGGGTAGWLAAAALSHQMGQVLDITLVESSEIGTVGVGEATIPPVKAFHRMLQIDEQAFMRATHATFKLGINFENWKSQGESYFHSFGFTGKDTPITEFLHFWMRGREMGIAGEYGDYCPEYKAAMLNRFSTRTDPKLNHAFHLDAGLYAKFLKRIADAHGVKRVDGKIVHVGQDSHSGYITHITLDSGESIFGDLFIDCTGFRGLLIEQTLRTGYEDWTHWLPCDSAVAVQTKSVGPAVPYTRSIAHHAGWRWQIPLQHRVGNGLVFCSKYMSEDEAVSKLLNDVEGETLTEPKVIRFVTGKRKKGWNKNCVALGLASGFLEPLESTSIHLVMTALVRILRLLPERKICPSIIQEYNDQAASEMERIRDFIILHYKVTERDDSPFWQYCRQMEVPEQLAHRIQLFKDTGKSFQVEGELFRLNSWTQVMLGQGLVPEQYHPIARTMKSSDLKIFLQRLHDQVDHLVHGLPSHADFVREYCRAD